MNTHLIFDASNILQRTYMAGWSSTGDRTELANLALHSAMTTLNKYFKKYNPTHVVCAFDRPNWRKDYTKSDLCLSGQVYKANRRQNMSPMDQMRYEEFLEHIEHFEQILREHTSIISLAADKLEADDLIAGVAEKYCEDRVIILSADKDLIQLLKYPNTLLIDPATDKPRECEDVDWFMFLKCIRGDRGDNVRSAFPRVRETRVRLAYEDELERLNLMNEEWTDQDGKTESVKNLFDENKLLMDLFSQPQAVRRRIFETITQGYEDRGKYSYFHFVKFCNRHKLQNIRDNCATFAPLLSC